MHAIYLTEADVAALVDIDIALEAVEEAFGQLATDAVQNVPRSQARARGIVLHSMSAAAEYLGRVGWKQYTTTRRGARFMIGLYENKTGRLEALIEADRLGQLRTGAATGVAVRHLALEGATRAGLIGCGWQARTQLAAVSAVRPLQEVRVYSRDPQKRVEFAETMAQQVGIDVVAVDVPRDAVAGLPIVVTATTSRSPVLSGEWLSAGATVCAMGSNSLQRAELDLATVQRANRVICDSIEAVRPEAGDFVEAIESGDFDWAQSADLADVITGKVAGRVAREDIVLFKSVGLAVQDVALASRVVDLARSRGMGVPLPF